MITGFNSVSKNMFKIDRFFEAVKMNFGSKFGAKVSFLTAMLKS